MLISWFSRFFLISMVWSGFQVLTQIFLNFCEFLSIAYILQGFVQICTHWQGFLGLDLNVYMLIFCFLGVWISMVWSRFIILTTLFFRFGLDFLDLPWIPQFGFYFYEFIWISRDCQDLYELVLISTIVLDFYMLISRIFGARLDFCALVVISMGLL